MNTHEIQTANIVNIHTDSLRAKMNLAFETLKSLTADERESVLRAMRRNLRGANGQQVVDTFVDRYREKLSKVLRDDDQEGAS